MQSVNSLCNIRSQFNNRTPIFFESSRQSTLVVKSGKVQNSGYPKWRANANHGCDLQGEILEFSAFPLSLQLMFNQTLNNLLVCLMISQKLHTKVAQTNLHVAVESV